MCFREAGRRGITQGEVDTLTDAEQWAGLIFHMFDLSVLLFPLDQKGRVETASHTIKVPYFELYIHLTVASLCDIFVHVSISHEKDNPFYVSFDCISLQQEPEHILTPLP